jgi:hypothetical protein
MAIRKTFGNKDAEPPKKGQKILMDTLEKSRNTNEFLRGESRNPSGGTKAPKGDRAILQSGRGSGGTRPPGGGPIRSAQKGGLPEIRRSTQPVEYKKPGTSMTEYKKPGGSVTEYKKPSGSVAEYKKPGTSVSEYKKPIAGGGYRIKSEGWLDKAKRLAKGPIGLGAATAGFYFGDTFSSKTGNQANYGEQAWIDDKNNRGPLMKGNAPNTFSKSGPIAAAKEMRKGAPRQIAAIKAELDDRKKTTTNSLTAPKSKQNSTVTDTSPENKKANSVGGTKNGPFKSKFAEGLQGQNKKKSGSKAATGNAPSNSGSSKASKPMSNFERQKQRMYEKEGYNGRSLTSSGAKARVLKERSYKFKDLFKKK